MSVLSLRHHLSPPLLALRTLFLLSVPYSISICFPVYLFLLFGLLRFLVINCTFMIFVWGFSIFFLPFFITLGSSEFYDCACIIRANYFVFFLLFILYSYLVIFFLIIPIERIELFAQIIAFGFLPS